VKYVKRELENTINLLKTKWTNSIDEKQHKVITNKYSKNILI